jgi:uncharacterized membrane protein YbaN (DUF454 family)
MGTPSRLTPHSGAPERHALADKRLMPSRYLWLALGFAATGCGIIGAVLPLVPTTPFLLVAAYAFAKSSPRFHGWLLNHPRFGPLIRNWQRHGSIDPSSKRLALLVMGAALVSSWMLGFSMRTLGVQAVVLAASATFILTRPDGPA